MYFKIIFYPKFGHLVSEYFLSKKYSLNTKVVTKGTSCSVHHNKSQTKFQSVIKTNIWNMCAASIRCCYLHILYIYNNIYMYTYIVWHTVAEVPFSVTTNALSGIIELNVVVRTVRIWFIATVKIQRWEKKKTRFNCCTHRRLIYRSTCWTFLILIKRTYKYVYGTNKNIDESRSLAQQSIRAYAHTRQVRSMDDSRAAAAAIDVAKLRPVSNWHFICT